jgi:bla regulator protein blaR1
MQLLFLRQWFSDEIMQATGWTLIHSLWQGLLAAAVAAVIIISTRKTAASVRYNLLGIVMVLFLVTTFITFGKQLNIAAITGSTDPSSPVVAAGEVFITSTTPLTDPAVSASFMDTFIAWFNSNADVFVLGWTLFFFLNCLKLFTGMASVHRLRQYRTHPVTEDWKNKAEQLGRKLGIRRNVTLLQSELVKVPIALGVLKPVILVPMGLITHLPPAQVETILLHELAHIRRSDYLVNLIQRFAEAVFFFNPAFLWISSLMRQEREACCDDVVIANTDQKRQYLDALVAFQEYSLNRSYAMAITSRRDYLLARVKRMLTRENKRLGLFEKLALFAGLILFSAFTYLSKEGKMMDVGDRIEWSDKPTVYAVSPKSTITAGQTGQMGQTGQTGQTGQQAGMSASPVAPAAPKDTVPPKREAIRKMLEGHKFKKIETSTVNTNGDEKMLIVVTGPDNKKYAVQRNNGKFVGMTIDDKPVDAKELPDWTPLFEMLSDEITSRAKKDQDEKYKEQIALREKIKDAAQQQSIYKTQMDELHSKQIEAKSKHNQKIEDLRKEYFRKKIDGDKKVNAMRDSVERWGKELDGEMKKLSNDMKELLKKEPGKNDKGGRIGKPRDGKLFETRERKLFDKPRSGGRLGNTPNEDRSGKGDGDGNNNGNSNSNGSGNGNGNDGKNEDKPRISKEENGSRNTKNEKNVQLLSNNNKRFDLSSEWHAQLQSELQNTLPAQIHRELNGNKDDKAREQANEKKQENKSNVKIESNSNKFKPGVKIETNDGKTKPRVKLEEKKWDLNKNVIQKVNYDFEKAIKVQLSENLHFDYSNTVYAAGEMQYDTRGRIEYKPMPVAPVTPAPLKKKDAPKKDNKTKNFNLQSKWRGVDIKFQPGWDPLRKTT